MPRIYRLLSVISATLLTAGLWVASNGLVHAATSHHYTANDDGQFSTILGLGYNLADVSPSGADSLPSGQQAVAWVGEKCPSGVSSAFTSQVDAHRGDSKIFAWYLSDEPHVANCPGAPSALAAEADYIHANNPGQLAFIILLNSGNDYAAMNQSVTHVDAIGLDPYPCSTAHPDCPVTHIDDHVNAAEAAGISQSVIVPTFQAFADSYYTMPTPSQLQAMLDEWAKLVPNPPFDYTYSWGCQSSLTNCLERDSADQQVMAAHNSGSSGGTSTTTTVPPTTTSTAPTTTAPPATTTTTAPPPTTTGTT